MKYNTGEYVVYCSKEICIIDSIVKKSFNGISESEYFKLIPVYTKKTSYYIPCNNCDSKVRPLITKKEIYSLINEMSNAKLTWCDDKNTRKSLFNSILKSNDYHQIINMIHSIYVQRENQISNGKKLHLHDEKIMLEAEHLIHQEFAFVLGIDENQVEDFILSKISPEV